MSKRNIIRNKDMSHFSVLVSIKEATEKALSEALQPFHEYECTGIKDQYVKFIEAEEGIEDLQKEYKDDHDDYDCFEEFISDYYGYEFRDGKVGRLTNPNHKWDWWSTGGRWSNTLISKDGKSCDDEVKSNIDFSAMKKRSVDNHLPTYDDIHQKLKGESWLSWKHVRDDMDLSIEDARKTYHDQDAIKLIRKMNDSLFFDADQFLMSRDEYISQKEFEGISCFAILHDGNWIQKGDMGWWGCVSGEKNPQEWSEIYQEAINKIPDDYTLVVVDCHI